MTPSPVEGLPPGVDFVRIGVPKDDTEFYIVNEPDGKGGHAMRIVQGARAASFPSPTPHLTAAPNVLVIVRPSEGWKFKPSIIDLGYRPVRKIDPPAQVAASVIFSVDDEEDKAAVSKALDGLKKLPGFGSIS